MNAPHAPGPGGRVVWRTSYVSPQLVASMGLLSVTKGVQEKVPADKRVMEGAKLMGTIHVETQAQWLNLASEIYK